MSNIAIAVGSVVRTVPPTVIDAPVTGAPTPPSEAAPSTPALGTSGPMAFVPPGGLHPMAGEAATRLNFMRSAPNEAVKAIGDGLRASIDGRAPQNPKDPTEPGGFTGFLHTVATLGSGGGGAGPQP